MVRALLVAAARKQVTNDATEQRSAGDTRPGVVTNILVGSFSDIARRFGRFPLEVLKFIGYFSCLVGYISCFHQANINR